MHITRADLKTVAAETRRGLCGDLDGGKAGHRGGKQRGQQ